MMYGRGLLRKFFVDKASPNAAFGSLFRRGFKILQQITQASASLSFFSTFIISSADLPVSLIISRTKALPSASA